MGSLQNARRILYVDAYDSFTNNIIGLLEKYLSAEVVLVHIDDEEVSTNLVDVVNQFDAVVIGPGPGHPANGQDVGFIRELWALDDKHMLPILGICLGFQSLCHSHGALVKRLPMPRHGIVSRVSHNESDIFDGFGDLDATQYHSLHVEISAEADNLWAPSKSCPDLLPLAWDFSDHCNGRILMSARHIQKPFWGVQFHPESICTSEAGRGLIANWWLQAQEWLHARIPRAPLELAKTPTVLPRSPIQASNAPSFAAQSHLATELRAVIDAEEVLLRWGKHPAANVSPVALVEALGHSRDDIVLLDSQGHTSGRFSIIGLKTPGKTMMVTYKVHEKRLHYSVDANSYSRSVPSLESVWPILQEALDLHNPQNKIGSSRSSSPGSDFCHTGMDRWVASHLPDESPFWGGFMGYITYEAGLETIDVQLNECQSNDDEDVHFAFIHRSIVIDHARSEVYIQSLLPGDWSWILQAGRTLDGLVSQEEIKIEAQMPSISNSDHKRAVLDAMLNTADVVRPTEPGYREKVLECQGYLSSGDSYELCLTDQSTITSESPLDSWALYKKLRQNNPAPFGAFIRLSDTLVVGSSPERFLRWTRGGHVQFRPIKGTVKKGPGMTSELAHSILGTSKERAENLMIVDLIRHDLSGVIGAANTWVSKLMVVEEYEKVYQLVSVIEGQLEDTPNKTRGIHVLKASLPPGSMTGAPKKRSCEILREIEGRRRGIYSGVLGYMDVGGSGDFSVVIRTALGKKTRAGEDMWRVGAGGAVTIQSTDEGEYLEMDTKASTVLSSILN